MCILTKGFMTTKTNKQRFSISELKEHGHRLSALKQNIGRLRGRENGKGVPDQMVVDLTQASEENASGLRLGTVSSAGGSSYAQYKNSD